jgi:outer membrane protein assembly factor BamA
MRTLRSKKIRGLLFLFILLRSFSLFGQDTILVKQDSVKEVDVTGILKKIFNKSGKPEPEAESTTKLHFAILPTLSYNPSFGFIFGGKLTGGKQYGDPANTDLSVFALEFFYGTKGIISAQAKHNIFTAGNKWNWQGQWQLAKYGLLDYGLGTGNFKSKNGDFSVDQYPIKNADSAFPISYTYIRLSEKAYRKIGKYFYAGGGVRLDMYSNIDDIKQTTAYNTPHERYSLRHDFDPNKYSANGFILAVQYNTREHPIRSYGGIYADMGLQFNQKWMGSSKNAIQLQYDFRKYWSLSKKNPENVIAFWHWAAYKLSGVLPYLEMPSTASDPYGRSGRGYTFSRFKGPAYACFETEWRFPITRNKLISGVCFFNLQTASDDFNKKVFEAWEPGGGAGLRILFQKLNRTTMCIDFAKGRYGASGLFFGLGEAF